ncbi:prepilin peptidase [Alienimonas chondri]|uniref:Prepilin peptidase A24 N-terminal domain-containing protein n=1 Tax=Alienimonas chondri TaxID=2681879 RepID=A0ABX1VBG3_9PLAN|nr:prepilin peptidase [Alienimonas chondri]NNJ25222.1 hypothetical protein [Alienimonas chondri]
MPPSGFADWAFILPLAGLPWAGAAASNEWLTGLLRAFIVLWSFALGASVGSFLNVVVYRLPAGLNLSRPKSRCPRCETPIRATDNLPVIGWLRLRGRCRACGLPIAARYPLVEAVCGTALALLALQIVLMGGVNLPVEIGRSSPSALFLRALEPAAIAVCGVLFIGSATLFGAGLIALDGHRLPWRFVAFALLFPAIAAGLWPGVRIGAAEVWGGGPWQLAEGGFALGPYRFAPNLAGPLDVLRGAALCALIGGLLFPLLRTGTERTNLLLIGGIAGAWWGMWAGGWGLALGGAVTVAAPMLYAAGLLRSRVAPPTLAAMASALVPLGWILIGTDPPSLLVRAWGSGAPALFLLGVGVLIDRAFFPHLDPAPSNPAPNPDDAIPDDAPRDDQGNSGSRQSAAAPPKQTATSEPGSELRSG